MSNVRQRRGIDGYYHPSSESEICDLVRLARREGVSLRVRGSGHSIPAAIHSDGFLAGKSSDIEISLDRYTQVDLDTATGRVTVQAGCRLGKDPRDPSGLARFEVSLLAQLEKAGFALPDLGGVTHQTVAGFFMTGSCGGTVRFSNEDAIVAFRFVDGEGNIHDVARGSGDLFDAFGCSMGLLGVLSTITFECIPRYDITGREDVTPVNQAPFDMFERGPRGMETFFRETDYARLMWWPQSGVERLVTWQASRMTDQDYAWETGPRGALTAKPYDAIRAGLVSPALTRGVSLGAQWAGGKVFDLIAQTRAGATRLSKRAPAVAPTSERLGRVFTERLLPTVLDQFVQVDTSGPQYFWDTWWHGLPMDNQMSEDSLPTTFTEIWVPLERSHEVMTLLEKHFREGGFAATGAFLFEVYAARASRYWMHPGFLRDSLRIDVFWFERNTEDPTTAFFPQFWKLLRKFGYRLHWGKHLPKDDALGAEHLRLQTPHWDDFLTLRQRLDPDGIFLTQHYRKALGVAS